MTDDQKRIEEIRGLLDGSITGKTVFALDTMRFLLAQIDKRDEALRLCRRITLDLKYGNDPEWVRINVDGAIRKTLGEE